MDRFDWLEAVSRGQEELFFGDERVLTCFTATGYRFESILSRDPNSIMNVPELYDSLRDLLFVFKKLLETLSGSTSVVDFEVEGDVVKFSSYRLGHQRRLNILTPVEADRNVLFKWLTATLGSFKDPPIGAFGEGETGIPMWTQGDLPDFLIGASLADGHSMVERGCVEFGLGRPVSAFVQGQVSAFGLHYSADRSHLLLVQQLSGQEAWLNRLTGLLGRIQREEPYSPPPSLPDIPPTMAWHVSMVILRRFLSYLLPRQQKGRVRLDSLESYTGLSPDLIVRHFEETLKPEYLSSYKIQLLKEQTSEEGVTYFLEVEEAMQTRVLTHTLMGIKRFQDQVMAQLPSRSSQGMMQSPRSAEFLGEVWGNWVLMQFLGESDEVYNLYLDISSNIQDLAEMRTLLEQLRKADEEGEEALGAYGPPDEVKARLASVERFVSDDIQRLNVKITRFISGLVQGYYLLLKTIPVPKSVSTPFDMQDLTLPVELVFGVDGRSIIQDLPKHWLVLAFFDGVLFSRPKERFISTLGPTLQEFWKTIDLLWSSLQLLTIDASEENWLALQQVQDIFIKPTVRRGMLSKVKALELHH